MVRQTSGFGRLRRAAVACLLACGLPLAAEEVELRWNDLAGAVSGKKVTVESRYGTRVEGKVRLVDAQGLALASGKGETFFPRDTVSRIELHRRGNLLRGVLVGVGAGAVGTAVCAGLLAAQAKPSTNASSGHGPETMLIVGGAAAVGGVIVGVSTGRQSVRKAPMVIRIAVEDKP